MIPKEHHPDQFGPDVLATLVKARGNTGAVINTLLERYGYQEDSADGSRWKFPSEDGTRSGVVFDDKYIKVGIIGTSDENIENMNFILSKAGWETYDLYTLSPEIEAAILGKCHSIMVVEIDHDWDESAGPIFAEEPEITIPTSEPAREEVPPPAQLTVHKTRPAPAAPAQTPSHQDGLVGVVEELLLQQLANSPDILQNTMVQRLKAAGYEIRLSLVRKV